MLAVVDRIQHGSEITWSEVWLTLGRILSSGRTPRLDSDFVLYNIFVLYAGLRVVRSTNGVVWWEELKFCKSGMSDNYHSHHQTILRIKSPALALYDSGSNWVSSCKWRHYSAFSKVLFADQEHAYLSHKHNMCCLWETGHYNNTRCRRCRQGCRILAQNHIFKGNKTQRKYNRSHLIVYQLYKASMMWWNSSTRRSCSIKFWQLTAAGLTRMHDTARCIERMLFPENMWQISLKIE